MMVDELRIVERMPSVEELLKRIHWDPVNKRVVYISTDTGRVVEVMRIPDVHHRSKHAKRSVQTDMAARYMAMDDANMRRAMEANPKVFFGEIRDLANAVRTHHIRKEKALPRLRHAGRVAKRVIVKEQHQASASSSAKPQE